METEKFFYANGVRVTASPWDVNLTFSRNIANSNAGETTEVDSSTVSMSVSHAKSLLVILYEMLKQVESDLGPAPLPPEFRERFDRAFGHGMSKRK